MKRNRAILNHLIDEWLADYRESDGGWAAITREDIFDLYSIVRCLINLKCQADPDGDRPIDFHLVNRTQYWPLQFCNVPYDHESPASDVLKALLSNATRANGQLDNFLQTLKHYDLLKESE